MSQESYPRDSDYAQFKSLLEQQYKWPSPYSFKFIIPVDQFEKISKLFPGHFIEQKMSKNGNYTSCTISLTLDSPDHVIAIYQQAAQIKGLISI